MFEGCTFTERELIVQIKIKITSNYEKKRKRLKRALERFAKKPSQSCLKGLPYSRIHSKDFFSENFEVFTFICRPASVLYSRDTVKGIKNFTDTLILFY